MLLTCPSCGQTVRMVTEDPGEVLPRDLFLLPNEEAEAQFREGLQTELIRRIRECPSCHGILRRIRPGYYSNRKPLSDWTLVLP